ncbi:MAG TPA: LacI family DNA-binding transcriptional regulator [Gaiellaceae bacterium]|jgi:LacI family transcriptional regulator
MKRLTIRDVAARAGVSLGTVSNVLNRPDLVAPETRERVLEAIDAIGFVRNNAARQLRGIRSSAIALVVLDIDNPFFTEVARGVEDAANEHDHLVILCSSAGERTREDRQLRALEEQRVAGVLISPAGKMPSQRIHELRGRGTPVVLLHRNRRPREQCSAAVNDTSGGRLVAEHLVSLGHERIGFINGPIALKPCAERRAGLLEILEAHGLGLAPQHDLETAHMTINAGEEAAARLLGQRRLPTAIFCANDLLAIGAEHAALTRGLRVPDDLAIVGYDDIRYAAMSFVPLTSVHMPAYELGYRATKLLVDEVHNGSRHQHQRLLFEPELIVRQSTLTGDGRPAAAAEAVRSA